MRQSTGFFGLALKYWFKGFIPRKKTYLKDITPINENMMHVKNLFPLMYNLVLWNNFLIKK